MAQFPSPPNTATGPAGKPELLAWSQDDIENRFGFKGGRHTGVNHVFAFVIAGLLTGAAYALTVFLLQRVPLTQGLAAMILRPSNQYTMIPATLFFFGGAAVLWLKSRKLKFQQRALQLAAVPAEPEFVLTEATAATVLTRLHALVDHPRHFVLLNRIDRALSNLKNIGQVNDVSAILRAQAENDEDQVASSYTLLNGLVWAIPVLGFIGTVQGLSMAIGKFTQTLQASGDISMIRTSLQGVTSGLATAFETTLIALVLALILQLWITFTQKREMAFLDECNDYCHSHVVSKLRLIDRAPAAQS
ncbi:MAG TPA: MotA/TolQ/ExbB proton channel family protein [Dongiaceae bacterium]|nr:MotA/TolQ/ExbB proton channel family protein [Dongiaceae bacterium]